MNRLEVLTRCSQAICNFRKVLRVLSTMASELAQTLFRRCTQNKELVTQPRRQNIWERARSHTMAQQRPHGASCTRRIGAVLPALYASARGLSHRAAPRTPPPVLSFTPCSRRVSRHATSNQELRAPKLREARRTARAIARRSKRRANARRARHREPARARREGACRLDVDFPSLLSPLVRPPPFLRCGVLRVGYVPLDRSRSLRRFVASCRSESHACAKKAPFSAYTHFMSNCRSFGRDNG